MSRDELRRARFAQEAAEETTTIPRAEATARTRRSVLTGLGAVALAGVGWRSLLGRPEDGNIPDVLRRGFEFNEAVWGTLYDPGRLAPEFAVADREAIRVNGTHGLESPINLDRWQLRVEGPGGVVLDELTMADLADDLPEVDQVTEHKCIEGWSNVVHWTGYRFADLAARYESVVAQVPYVSLQTPDRQYYVGLDTDTIMHPQSILAHSWNGQPLTADRGAPLRLATPLHYGIKALKRVGVIRFTDQRPRDYWGQRGYDWDSSH